MHGCSDHKIYLQPLGFLRGCSASLAVERGVARWLSGGLTAFTMVKIISRRSEQKKEDMVSIGHLEGYISGLPHIQKIAIEGLLRNICDCRPIMEMAMTRCQPKKLEWTRPLLQGIVNVTPDSFSDGGQYNQSGLAVAQARHLIGAGADIIDIGGESTRPGAASVSIDQELERVIPVIEQLSDISVPISIDTRNAGVMEAALRAGANIINDVSALSHDKNSLTVAAKANCPVILMHAQNGPEIMQDNPHYDDVVLDVYDYLEHRLATCLESKIERRHIIIDPGIGFGKTLAHNLALMADLSLFHGLGVPIMLGVSRKSFIGKITGEAMASDRFVGSLAFGQMGYDQGIQILRVHDVLMSSQARDAWCALGL